MVVAETLCAISLAYNAIVDGACCFYQMKQESKRQEENEKIVRRVVQTELQSASTDLVDDPGHQSSKDNLVQAYKTALWSRCSEQPDSDPLDDDHDDLIPVEFVPPRSLQVLEKRQPPSPPHHHMKNRFPIGIPARHQSFSRVTTKKFDNTYKLNSIATHDDDSSLPDLFLYSSSSSSSTLSSPRTSSAKKHQPSFVNGYTLRKRSELLPPIRTVSSLLEEASSNHSEYEDHNWLGSWDNKQQQRVDVDSLESISFE